MKCPKCGSTLHSERIERNEYQSYWMYRCENVECENHKPFDTNELNKQQDYKNRLDKVLSKFERVGISTYLYKKNGFQIGYNDTTKQFTLFRQVLELDTIELLTRDMETHNETK